jgi:hypothetical protein
MTAIQSDRSKPMPIEIAKGQLGSDYMYRVSLRDLVKAKERIRIAAIRVPGADGAHSGGKRDSARNPEFMAPKTDTPSPEGHIRGNHSRAY